MCEVSLRDTVGEETLCAEMVGDRAFIRPTEGSLLLFWDLSWVQSERAADRRVSSLLERAHTLTHTGRNAHARTNLQKCNDMLTVVSIKLADLTGGACIYGKSINSQ